MCNHQWRQIHEQSILGGQFPVGWQCEACNEYVSQASVPPTGLGGEVTGRHELVGIHGTAVVSASGQKAKRQVYDETTKALTYVGKEE